MEFVDQSRDGIPLRGVRLGSGRPSIVITGGIHGDEQTGSYTARLVAQRLEKETLLGEVTVYPVCNESAARARQRCAPQDGLDLNRIFPGRADGSYSQRLANSIWRATEGFDYLLDLHCCGVYGSTYAMHCYSCYDFAGELCRALGVETVIHSKGTRGQLYIEACERGQKGLLVELPGGQPGGVINEKAAEALAERIIHYLKYLGIAEGTARLSERVSFCGCLGREGGALRDGLCRPAVAPGSSVRAGEAIAYIDGEAFPAPYDAVVTSIPPLRFVCAGEAVARFAPAAPVPKGGVPVKPRACPEEQQGTTVKESAT